MPKASNIVTVNMTVSEYGAIKEVLEYARALGVVIKEGRKEGISKVMEAAKDESFNMAVVAEANVIQLDEFIMRMDFNEGLESEAHARQEEKRQATYD